MNTSGGIYVILIGDEFYLGRTNNLRKRMLEHTRQLNKKEHHSYKLQKAFDANPNPEFWCVFKFNELSDPIAIEQEYLNKYKPSLNVSESANNAVLSKEQVLAKQGGARNHMAKLTLDDAMAIVIFRNTRKYSMSDIAYELDLPLPAVTTICSGKNWCDELMKFMPEDYQHMVDNKTSLGIELRHNYKPPQRAFDNVQLLDILKMILSRKYSLQEIGDVYGKTKQCIQAIRYLEVYKSEIKELLSDSEYEALKNIPKGQLKL